MIFEPINLHTFKSSYSKLISRTFFNFNKYEIFKIYIFHKIYEILLRIQKFLHVKFKIT